MVAIYLTVFGYAQILILQWVELNSLSCSHAAHEKDFPLNIQPPMAGVYFFHSLKKKFINAQPNQITMAA